jgi:hypothetical protein
VRAHRTGYPVCEMDPETRLRRAAIQLAAAEAERDVAIREAAEAGMRRRAIAAIAGTTLERVHRAIEARLLYKR